MNNKIICISLVGAMGVCGSVQAAQVYNQDGVKLDIYGNIQLAYFDIDTGEKNRDQLADNGSTFGFLAEHSIGDDLVGYLRLEIDDFKADELKTAGRDAGDTAYVGLRGPFGDLRLGSYDQLINDWIQNAITQNEIFNAQDSTKYSGAEGQIETDTLTYFLPAWNGLELAVGTQYKGSDEDENAAGSGKASSIIGAKYSLDSLSFAAAYDDMRNHTDDQGNSLGDQYGAAVNYDLGALRLSMKLEAFDTESDTISDADFYALAARYSLSTGRLYASYQRVNIDETAAGEESNLDEFILGGTHLISDAMYAWVEAVQRGRDDGLGDGVGVGITYLF